MSGGKLVENDVEEYVRLLHNHYWLSKLTKTYDFSKTGTVPHGETWAKNAGKATSLLNKSKALFAKLPPLTTGATLKSGNVKSYTYDSDNLTVQYQGGVYPTPVSETGQVKVVKPGGGLINSVVVILPAYNESTAGINLIIEKWQLQNKANSSGILFVIPKMNTTIYESTRNPKATTWWSGANGKLPGLTWITEVIPSFVAQHYLNNVFYQDLFFVGIDTGAAGAIKAASTLPFAKGIVAISGAYHPVIYPDSTTGSFVNEVAEYNKYKGVLGERNSNDSSWIKEDLIRTPALFECPVEFISESGNAFYKGETDRIFKEYFSNVSNATKTNSLVPSSAHNNAFWHNAKLISHVFNKISNWTSKRGTDKAQVAKETLDSSLKLEIKRVINQEDLDISDYKNLNKPTGKILPDTVDSEKLIQILLKKQLFDVYSGYLASLGLVAESVKVEGNYTNTQLALLQTKLARDEARTKAVELKNIANITNDINDQRKAYAAQKEVDRLRELQRTQEKALAAEGKPDLYPDFVAKVGKDGSKMSELERLKQIAAYGKKAAEVEKANKQLEAIVTPNVIPETSASIKTKSDTSLVEKFDTTLKETVASTPTVANTGDTNLFKGKDPLAAQITTSTQLLKGDFMDARRYEAIMPIFYQSEVPAYITLKPDIGAPGAYSSAELGLAASDTTKTNQPAELSDPFKNGLRYNQFTLTGLNESHGEKYQIVDTLANGQVIFSFGKKPEIWGVQGVLINDIYSNWLGKFREVWDEHLRISKLVEKGKYARFVIPSQRIAFNGYPLALTLNHSSATEQMIPFSMLVFIREVKNFTAFPFDNNSAISAMATSLLFADGVKF